jgi:hypothetical protein
MSLRSIVVPGVALATACVLLSGCLVASVAGATVGVAGAAVGVTAKAAGATAKAAGSVISGGKKDDKGGG